MTKKKHKHPSYQDATGKNDFGLTNDYMFRAVFQENELARKGLIAAVLHMKPDEIQSVIIRNPIKLGEKIEDKEFILDIEVMLNNNHLINLEMQMTDQHNWQDRSLSYLCRSFDQLYKGEKYSEAKPASHIGFLNFAPFPDSLEFNATYKLLNVKNHLLYSDKLSLHVVDLTHIELATEEDKAWNIDYWARLFTATTWEDVKMIAEKDIHMKAAAEEMYVLSADELIQERCRARDDYMKNENTRNKIMNELNEALAEKNKEIDAKDKALAEKDNALAEKDNALAEKDNALAEKDAYIKQLEARLSK